MCHVVHLFSARYYLQALSALCWLALEALLVELAWQLGTHISVLLHSLGHTCYSQTGISGGVGWAAHC